MSHLTERKENNCLNCGAIVQGRFCHVCGQENIEPKESFWHLVTHFVYDVTHFDGKFFSTLKYLLFRPGFLSHEYLRGRRASYLHPIRMYVFTSAFFFLILFSMGKEDDIVKVNTTSESTTAASVMKKVEKKKNALTKTLTKNDSNLPVVAKLAIQKKIDRYDSFMVKLAKDSMLKTTYKTLEADNTTYSSLWDNDTLFNGITSYDSAQEKLPSVKRDGFIMRRIMHQKLHMKEKFHGDSDAMWKAVFEKFKHLFPQMLFVSLPLFALMMQMLYFRKKSFYYVNHVVFTIHLYCGTFIIILAGMLIDSLLDKIGYEGQWDNFIFGVANFIFWYKSMRHFYEQRRAKTILKYMIVLFLSLIIMTLIFAIFFIFSAMAI